MLHFLSNPVTFTGDLIRYVFGKARSNLYKLKLPFIFHFLLMAAHNVFNERAVVRGYREALGVCVSSQVQAVLRSKNGRCSYLR